MTHIRSVSCKNKIPNRASRASYIRYVWCRLLAIWLKSCSHLAPVFWYVAAWEIWRNAVVIFVSLTLGHWHEDVYGVSSDSHAATYQKTGARWEYDFNQIGLLANISWHTKMSGEYGSHHGSGKILFANHSSREVNSADHTSWKIWNPT